jgi:23S rRNA-/tRNA-specific pseudouridylate synthase
MDELVKGFLRRLGEIICEKLESEHRIDHGTSGTIIMYYMAEAARRASTSSTPS